MDAPVADPGPTLGAVSSARPAARRPKKRRAGKPAVKASAPQKRIDPKPRPIEGVPGQIVLKNKDENKHYVIVYTNGDQVGHYMSIGYEIEEYAQGGVDFLGWRGKTRARGDEMSWRGHVLMSQPRDEWAARNADGLTRSRATEVRMQEQGGRDPFMSNDPDIQVSAEYRKGVVNG